MSKDDLLDRRRFAGILAALGGSVAVSRFISGRDVLSNLVPDAWATESVSAPELARYPQKTDLILLTDRPPQLETPLRYFTTDLTPNDAFYVRSEIGRAHV